MFVLDVIIATLVIPKLNS